MKIPLTSAIIELLQKKGMLTDTKMLELLKETYAEVSESALNEALMKLEIMGLIHVSSSAKAGKSIELTLKPEEG